MISCILVICCAITLVHSSDTICDFIAATNIGTLDATWTCNGGISTPCTTMYTGVTCTNNVVTAISLASRGIKGMK